MDTKGATVDGCGLAGPAHDVRAGSAGSNQPRAPLLTIRRKIVLAFLVMSAITGSLGAYAVRGIVVNGQLVVDTYDHSLMSISYARAAVADFAQMQAARDNVRPTTDLLTSLRDDLDVAQDRARSVRARDATEAALRAVAAWRAAPDWDEETLRATAKDANDQLDLLINITAGEGFQFRQRALATISSSTQLAAAATAAALMLTGVVTALLSGRIMKPLAAASAAAARIASGELDAPIPRTGADELGALLSAMAVMRDNIRAMMETEVAQRRSAQGMLVDAIESSQEGVALTDPQGRVIMANSRLIGIMPALIAHLAPGHDAAVALGSIAAAGRTEVALPDGRWFHAARSQAGHGGAVVILSDITSLKHQQAALELTNHQFHTALNTMSQGLCLFDGDERLLIANRRFREIFQMDAADVVPGMTRKDLFAAGVRRGVGDWDLFDKITAERRIAIAAKTPNRTFFELPGPRVVGITTHPMAAGGALVTYEDVTEQRRAEARISFLARNDALTGLPNRLRFRERLDEVLARPEEGAAVFCIDLDGFKAVNDTLGDAAGDALLREVADRIGTCVEDGEMLARLGGDEFAVVRLGACAPDDAAAFARQIVRLMGEPFAVDGQPIQIGASVGIAVAPHDAAETDALLRHADTALLRAKRDGRATYRFFEPAMDAKLQQRRALELDLRHAVTTEAFEVWYQPLMDLAHDRVSGLEALVRWRHPVRGMISPAEFIPVAEEIGLIAAIGAWVLRTATRQAASWPDGVKIAVNVSPLQFKAPGLVELVADALAVSGLRPGRLELEITESVLLTDSAATLAVLHRLHALGVRIAMDDFGTGYSSLSYLRSFPFDKIKIDQSFIRDLSGTDDAAAIVRAVVGLGASLGMRTTAEGVETAAQLAQLREEGCNEVQGYLFSKPRPAAEIAGLIAHLNGAALPATPAVAKATASEVPLPAVNQDAARIRAREKA